MPERRLHRTVALLAVFFLLAGYLNIARGASHAGAGYRLFAFRHHCYSDILALHGDRYLGGGDPLPYLEDRIEYPPLLGLVLWAPHFLGSALRHFTASYLFLCSCLFVALASLARLPGASPYWLGATPALFYYAGLNWDLFPIALLAWALLALERSRPARSGALCAAGVSAKLFPAVLLPPALAALIPERGSASRFFLGAAGVTALVNIPFAVLAFDNWSWFFRFNAGRGPENSVWDALHVPPGPLLEALSFGPLLLVTALGTFAAFRIARKGGDARAVVRLSVALSLVTWIATNKIWSPQYALYGFLAGALASAPFAWFLTLSALSAVDYHLAFEVRALLWDPWFRDVVWQPGNVIRALLWVSFAAFLMVKLLRERGSPEKADARPGLSSCGTIEG